MEKEGYVCPHCRILFSLPVALGGNGAECPGCGKLLTMPTPEDGVEAQGVSKISYQQAGLSSVEISENEATKEGQWNTERRKEVAKVEESDQALRWMLPIAIVSLLGLGCVIYVLLNTGDQDGAIAAQDVEEVINDSKEEEEVKVYNPRDTEDQNNLTEFLNQFYGAKTIEERMVFCRPTVGLKEKMTDYYNRKEFKVFQIKELIQSSENVREFGFINYNAENSNYDVVNGTVEYKNGKFLLDWESNVAYSEMSWADLKRLKPTEPVVLRIIARVSNYYNDDFTDDRKWQSLQILNPGENEEVIHAYVAKGSAVEQQVTNFGLNKDGYYVTVKAHYKEGATVNDQIIISEVVRDSWFAK